jgi:hypothetical protein
MRLLSAVLAVYLLGFVSDPSPAQTSRPGKMHDMSRPHPPIVTVPGQQLPLPPPSDAIVLFDGRNLSHWRSADSGAAQWTVRDGYFESVAGSGSIHTREPFGDVQLHVEWAAPVPASGTGQGRGNSGIILMGLYEIQILDSYHNDTYADGQASALYGQYPPLYNASRPPGEWQSYDIVFRRPRFDTSGMLLRPARVTVLHNGVLVQDNVEPFGPTSWLQNAPYKAHADRLPFSLQDHSSPVRFRNIWARDLEVQKGHQPFTPSTSKPLSLPLGVLDRYVGAYVTKSGFAITVVRDGEQILMNVGSDHVLLEAVSTREFALTGVDAKLEFGLDDKGVPDNCIFHIGGEQTVFSRRRK